MLAYKMEINQFGQWYIISKKRCGGYMPLKCVTMRLEDLFIIEKQWKTLKSKNITRGDEVPKVWNPLG